MKPEKGEPKYGYIGKTGTWIAEPKFDGMFYFRAAFFAFLAGLSKMRLPFMT